MTEQDNIQIAERYFEALNAHDFRRACAYHGDGFQFEAPGLPSPVGEKENEAYFQANIDTFPDLDFQVTEKIAQGDYVAMNWTAIGTHDGPLIMPNGDTIPPTGRKGAIPGSNTLQFKNGKIVRSRIYYDTMTVLAQLGVMPGS